MQVIQGIDYFYLFATTFFIVGLLTPLMRKIAIRADIIDRPIHSHKTHKAPVPYLGGVAIILGILIVSYGGLILKNRTGGDFGIASSLLIPATILGIIGLLDDRKSLPPLPRFIAQSIAGIFTAVFLIATNTVGNPSGNSAIDALITILWVVGITNAINFFDNLDGGAAGTVAISSIALAYLALSGDQYLIAALSTVTAGATLGFLVWNKSPAKIYMGDAGALFLGVLIATLTVRFEPDTQPQLTSYLIPIFLLAIPILDTTVAVSSRIRRHLSPFQGGQDHLSHRLIRAGLSRKAAAISLWGLSALFAIISVLISQINQNNINYIALPAVILWALLLIFFFRTKDV